MSKKRVSYQNLLKQAIAEFDTSKTVDVKGPMLDPILKWEGDGELPIYKDAASILERYYFDEGADKGVEVDVSEGDAMDTDSEDGTEKATDSEKHGEGTGTEQAGTADEKAMPARKSAIAKDLAKEGKEVEEMEASGKDVPKKKKYVDEEVKDDEEDTEEEDVTEDIENAVIEKLIAEMEEEDEEEDDDDDEEDDEEEDVKEAKDMSYEDDGVAPGMEAPKEKKASGPEDDTQGAGTEQAGTGTDAGQVPDRKDNADKMVKPKNYNEQEEAPADADDAADTADDEGEEAELKVDADVKEGKVSEVAGDGAGPIPPMAAKAKNDNKEGDEADAYEEAFKIFQESIEND